jgi:uncharacterized protein (DUF1697 family)
MVMLSEANGAMHPAIPPELYSLLMPVFISMLRGVNVGPHNRVKMDALRALYASLNLENPLTCVQSGNVIFRTREKNPAALSKRIQDAIAKAFGFRPEVILRTIEEFKKAMDASPFAARPDIEPGKLLVTFLVANPSPDAQSTLRALKTNGEEIHLKGRELYIYFPHGVGKSKLPWSSIEKLLKTSGTARNWNSIENMLKIAEEMEGLCGRS